MPVGCDSFCTDASMPEKYALISSVCGLKYLILYRYVASGPLVRSSYKAGEFFIEAMLDQKDAKSTTSS